jgi:chromosome segregation ATPase
MAIEQDHSQEFDLDKTDRLPILTAEYMDPEVAEEVARLDRAQAAMEIAEITAERPALADGIVNAPTLASSNMSADFIRPSSIDLPSLAESLRSVEERIAHQQAEYEALNRSFDRARESEQAAKAHAGQLETDLSSVKALLDAEQTRTREQEKTLAERAALLQSTQQRAEDALRDAERHQSESRLLKESLAVRDANITQALHSLGERDAQLLALQQEHAKIQQSLELRGRSSAQLEADLNATKLAVQELSAELAASRESVAALSAKMKSNESELTAVRFELSSTRTQAATYLEVLRTHEYRRGYEENLFLELDAKAGVADAGHNALKIECDRLLAEAADRDVQIAAHAATIEKLQANLNAQTATIAKQSHDLKQIETARAELNQRLTATEADLRSTAAHLADREAALLELRASSAADSERMSGLLAAAEERHSHQSAQFALAQAEHAASKTQMQTEHASALSEIQAGHAATVSQMRDDHALALYEMEDSHATKVAQMQREHAEQLSELQSNYAAATTRVAAEHALELGRQKALHEAYVQETSAQLQQRHEEMSVLMAHLQEARRPIEPIEAEVKRLAEELAAKSAAFEELDAEARKLRASLERTRGALEEREFLIRRLERSEMNNANVLGRIQTSMERLGSAPIPAAPLAPMPETVAELIRIDGGRNTAHTLGRRTRIGRGAGCELQVDSNSVSRHHALVVVGARDTIIEDLNSTNGVILNGRKITRAFLTDGDTVIVGEVQFRYTTKVSHRAAGQSQTLDASPASAATPMN